MPMIVGTRETRQVGNSYSKDPLYAYAKAFTEAAQNILTESSYDIFDEAFPNSNFPDNRCKTIIFLLKCFI